MGPKPIVGPALNVDARVAFLFESADSKQQAVSLLPDGRDLPTEITWKRRAEFALGVHEAMPVPIDPEPVMRGIEADGYFVWPTKRTLPFGTSQ